MHDSGNKHSAKETCIGGVAIRGDLRDDKKRSQIGVCALDLDERTVFVRCVRCGKVWSGREWHHGTDG